MYRWLHSASACLSSVNADACGVAMAVEHSLDAAMRDAGFVDADDDSHDPECGFRVFRSGDGSLEFWFAVSGCGAVLDGVSLAKYGVHTMSWHPLADGEDGYACVFGGACGSDGGGPTVACRVPSDRCLDDEWKGAPGWASSLPPAALTDMKRFAAALRRHLSRRPDSPCYSF